MRYLGIRIVIGVRTKKFMRDTYKNMLKNDYLTIERDFTDKDG